MKIENFSDIYNEYQLNELTLKGIANRLKNTQNDETAFHDNLFTNLQWDAFNKEGFWRGDNKGERRHIIIQGATSSGKTLVSEMAILDCLKSNKKSIVLVPLKAMVRERWECLKRDLEPQGTEQIYASSSDFKDHDGEIIHGDYEVAVIVYEKFFAMLSQYDNNMLNECELLVVDELQMLSSTYRGPKLEMAIQKVLRRNSENNSYVRIMCLTTSDCKISYIKKWLTIKEDDVEKEPILIESSTRPVGLREYVIRLDGTRHKTYFKGEKDDNEQIEKEKEIIDDKIDVEGYNKNLKSYESKKILLRSLLKNITETEKDKKILIYTNSRKNTLDLAKYIADVGIYEQADISEDLKRINEFEEDEYQKEMKNKLFSYKIAVHNAAMSTELREFVEDEFSRAENLRLVVATETLTVGMNMPVDVMILFDSTVHTGNGVAAQQLTSQQYKNFVGRAGRLGQGKKLGESYIIATSDGYYKRFCDTYVNCRKEEIESALLQAGEIEQAPYYLGLMDTNECNVDDLSRFWEASFSNKCNGKHIDMGKVLTDLKEAKLCINQTLMNKNRYKLSAFGRSMAPYALSLDTCQRIYYFFLGGCCNDEIAGVPENITAADIEKDRYLLDMLYILCDTEEVMRLGQLKLPDKNAMAHRNMLELIEKTLKSMLSGDNEANEKCELWENSPLETAICQYGIEDASPETIMRAILLWHWTKGHSISEIREKTQFDKYISIVNGDLSRMAEAVSYEIEAIYWCYSNNTIYNSEIVKPMYLLSTRIKYGMPREAVSIANINMHGLGRNTVLKIYEVYKKSGQYDTMYTFIKWAVYELNGIITMQKRTQLIDRMEAMYKRDNIDGILENIKNNTDGRLSEDACSAIKYMYNGYVNDINDAITKLKDIFFVKNNLLQNKIFFYEQEIQISKDDTGQFMIMTFEKTSATFIIGIYDKNRELSDSLRKILECGERNHVILLATTDNLCRDFRSLPGGCVWNLHEDSSNRSKKVEIVMTVSTFAGLITQDMSLNDTKGRILEAMLSDTEGIFRTTGLKATYSLLQNYQTNNLNVDDNSKEIIVVCDTRNAIGYKTCKSIVDRLREEHIPAQIINWGNVKLESRTQNVPVLLCLKEEMIVNSTSLKKFCIGIKDKNFDNVYALFDTENSYKTWQTNDKKFPCMYMKYSIGYDKIDEAVLKLKEMYRDEETPLIGISYAHDNADEEPRIAVQELRKLVKELNNEFGENRILFDENPSFKHVFDGNLGKTKSLELYKQCEYYIVLDDDIYDQKKCCDREGKIIEDKILKGIEAQHVWFVSPDNGKHCSLYNDDRDFATLLRRQNGEDIAKTIIEEINLQKSSK